MNFSLPRSALIRLVFLFAKAWKWNEFLLPQACAPPPLSALRPAPTRLCSPQRLFEPAPLC
jgi:hypothetical protein